MGDQCYSIFGYSFEQTLNKERAVDTSNIEKRVFSFGELLQTICNIAFPEMPLDQCYSIFGYSFEQTLNKERAVDTSNIEKRVFSFGELLQTICNIAFPE